MRRLTLLLMLGGLVLAGCQAAVQTPPVDRKTPLPGLYNNATLTIIPGQTPSVEVTPVPPPAILAAQQALSNLLELPIQAITISSFEAAQWPDGCLGLGAPGELCTQTVVSGYSVVLEANGQFYEFRTNSTGSVVRPVEFDPGPAGRRGSLSPGAGLFAIGDS